MNKQHGTTKMFVSNSILLEDNASVMSFHNKINDKNAYVKSQKCANDSDFEISMVLNYCQIQHH